MATPRPNVQSFPRVDTGPSLDLLGCLCIVGVLNRIEAMVPRAAPGDPLGMRWKESSVEYSLLPGTLGRLWPASAPFPSLICPIAGEWP